MILARQTDRHKMRSIGWHTSPAKAVLGTSGWTESNRVAAIRPCGGDDGSELHDNFQVRP